MFGIGSTELLVILVVALLVLGPEHLPKIMRTVGKGLADFRRMTTDFQRAINTEVAVEEEQRQKKSDKAAKTKKKKTVPTKPENLEDQNTPPVMADLTQAEPTVTANSETSKTEDSQV